MDKHFLTPLFAPNSIAVFAGKADAPESQTPQAQVLHPDQPLDWSALSADACFVIPLREESWPSAQAMANAAS